MIIPAPIKAGLVILASITFTLVAADIILRCIDYHPPLSHEWLLGPGADARLPDKNSILVRPRFVFDQHYALDPTLKTVVTIGDSFTEGFPVEPIDTYPAVLGRILDKRASPVNVINMGMGDSGPDQHLRLLKDYVLPKLKPDIVVWSFYSNDVADNILQAAYTIDQNSLVPLDTTEHWLYQRQKIFRGLPLPGTVKQSSPVLRLLFRALEVYGGRGVDVGNPSQLEMSITKIRLAVDEIERLAKLYEFQVTYVLVAPQLLFLQDKPPDPWGWDYQLAAYGKLRRVLTNQVRFIDARFLDSEIVVCGKQFKITNRGDPYVDDGRDHNTPGYRHFNESGYYLLAEAVATCLLDNTI
jgi:lysophospholipase L1-like esterase